MSLGRLSKELPELDLSSVVAPPTWSPTKYQTIINGFRSWVNEQKGLRVDQPVNLGSSIIPRMRMTSGPNKQVTLGSAPMEAKALLKDKELGKSFELFCTSTGLNSLLDYLRNFSNDESLDTSGTYLGKLALVPDSQNKHRLVAMVDY